MGFCHKYVYFHLGNLIFIYLNDENKFTFLKKHKKTRSIASTVVYMHLQNLKKKTKEKKQQKKTNKNIDSVFFTLGI